MGESLDEESLQQLYTWIDDIPLTRPKRNITRDFSDGVLIAEIIHHFIPKMVDLHNYSNANSSTQKMDNWNLLSRKALNKLSYNIAEDHVKGVVSCKPGVIEVVLRDLRYHIEQYLAVKKAASMLENNQIHDELDITDDYHSDQQQNGYDQGMSTYGYLNYTDPYAQPHQVMQGITETSQINPQYQYHSQPHVIQDIRGNAPYQKDDQALSPKEDSKTRKPVTQATKIKAKPAAKPQGNTDTGSLRMALEEKEQSLLASQETVQILQAKIRRLEHLLHLKDLRITELRGHPSQPPFPQHVSQPPFQQHHSPQKQSMNTHQQRHILHNTQTFSMPQHGGFPPHPPLPGISRPSGDDLRKY